VACQSVWCRWPWVMRAVCRCATMRYCKAPRRSGGCGADRSRRLRHSRAMAMAPGEQLHLRGWTGDSDAGINGAADSLASVAINIGSKALVQVAVQVAGVGSLTDYAHVEQLLRAVPGVQSSALTVAQGTTAVFNVGMRGGGEALVHALAGSSHLGAAATGETQVQLNYMP